MSDATFKARDYFFHTVQSDNLDCKCIMRFT